MSEEQMEHGVSELFAAENRYDRARSVFLHLNGARPDIQGPSPEQFLNGKTDFFPCHIVDRAGKFDYFIGSARSFFGVCPGIFIRSFFNAYRGIFIRSFFNACLGIFIRSFFNTCPGISVRRGSIVHSAAFVNQAECCPDTVETGEFFASHSISGAERHHLRGLPEAAGKMTDERSAGRGAKFSFHLPGPGRHSFKQDGSSRCGDRQYPMSTANGAETGCDRRCADAVRSQFVKQERN